MRILILSVGNLVLIGVIGSGRKSLAKLASFILSYEVKTLYVTQST